MGLLVFVKPVGKDLQHPQQILLSTFAGYSLLIEQHDPGQRSNPGKIAFYGPRRNTKYVCSFTGTDRSLLIM
ncbi:hypothetical protein AS145_00530 [Aeromonas hydrophila]|nr:hypothetical protein AS145_00530 [Aeromonas hydrophila]ALZ78181.1 hypothetical protein AhyD4_00530 [Aeromonas hydrophila]ODM28893.1 hypothetical protein A7J16_17975 [Aeromonas hydrophila]